MKFLKLLPILALLPGFAFAQSWEVAGFLGTSQYQGDIAPNIVLRETRPAIGVGVRRNFSDFFTAGLYGTYGEVSGKDSNTTHLRLRNLSFRSPIYELSAQMEFNFFRYGFKPNAKRWTPYVYTGLSFFKFNPRTKFNNEWHNLVLYNTEGQGLAPNVPGQYSLYSLAIPIGGGFKFSLNERWHLLVHSGWRTTFTDYLDDVSREYVDPQYLKSELALRLSDRTGELRDDIVNRPGTQRGNPDKKDWYIFTGFTLSYILDKGVCFSF